VWVERGGAPSILWAPVESDGRMRATQAAAATQTCEGWSASGLAPSPRLQRRSSPRGRLRRLATRRWTWRAETPRWCLTLTLTHPNPKPDPNPTLTLTQALALTLIQVVPTGPIDPYRARSERIEQRKARKAARRAEKKAAKAAARAAEKAAKAAKAAPPMVCCLSSFHSP